MMKNKILLFLKRLTSTPKSRKISGFNLMVCIVCCLTFSSFYVYVAGPSFFGTPGIGVRRGLFMLLTSIIIFLKYPASSKSPQDRASLLDWVWILASVFTFGYWVVNFDTLVQSSGNFNQTTMIFGILAIIISLEITRRAMGIILPIIASVFLLYAFLGQNLAGPIAHPGFPSHIIINQIFSQSGIFGIVLYTTTAYVVLFVVFGALLNKFGAGEFFVEFPYALTCGMKAGPAKAAVVASGLFGMISGSATANTTATGAFTIPLMKRAGYKPHVAGAIEPAASTGGMFMPPVMGAGVFIMAELIQMPYVKIMSRALVPALIYFFTVGLMAHFQAGLDEIPVVPKNERPNPLPILKKGWYYLLPIVLLIALIFMNYSPARAVYIALLVIIAINIVLRITNSEGDSVASILKNTIKDLCKGLIEGAENAIPVASVVGVVGILISVIMQTGLGFVFTSRIIEITNGILPVAILLTFFAAYLLGMGMIVTSAYLLLAVLIAPALQRMGVDPMAAHFLIFWYSQTSNISPPVCMAAFAGAAIANADPYRTGFTALKYSAMIIIVPLLFIYSPILMPDGFNLSVLKIWISASIGVVPFCASMIGYFVIRTSIIERGLLFLSGTLLFIPNFVLSLIGITILIIIFLKQLYLVRSMSIEKIRA